jgi:hypothetical protein
VCVWFWDFEGWVGSIPDFWDGVNAFLVWMCGLGPSLFIVWFGGGIRFLRTTRADDVSTLPIPNLVVEAKKHTPVSYLSKFIGPTNPRGLPLPTFVGPTKVTTQIFSLPPYAQSRAGAQRCRLQEPPP